MQELQCYSRQNQTINVNLGHYYFWKTFLPGYNLREVIIVELILKDVILEILYSFQADYQNTIKQD